MGLHAPERFCRTSSVPLVEDTDRGLLGEMGNCYADLQRGLRGHGPDGCAARGLYLSELKTRLAQIRRQFAESAEYKALTARFPTEFPR